MLLVLIFQSFNLSSHAIDLFCVVLYLFVVVVSHLGDFSSQFEDLGRLYDGCFGGRVTSTFVFNPEDGGVFDPFYHLNWHCHSDVRAICVEELVAQAIDANTKGINHLLSGAVLDGTDPLRARDEVHELLGLVSNFVILDGFNHAVI